MRVTIAFVIGACLLACPLAPAQTVADAGFEQVPVASGQFVKVGGPWAYTNDAGIVRPFGSSTTTEPLNTWSATRDAFEGAQYASTYAGGDTITQPVTFDQPGVYELSVMAFSPAGIQEIPGNPGLYKPLGNGEFRFEFGGGPVGPTWVVPVGSEWTRYATTVDVTQPGTYPVGIANTRVDVYFVDYDAFRIAAVPEPSAAALLLLTAGCAAGRRRRRP